eukprot:746009-Amphidinium_carterae.1
MPNISKFLQPLTDRIALSMGCRHGARCKERFLHVSVATNDSNLNLRLKQHITCRRYYSEESKAT